MKCPSYSEDVRLLGPAKSTKVMEHKDSPQKHGVPISPASGNASTPLESHNKGPHNKENTRHKRLSLEATSDDEPILGYGGLIEDSGYLSLQNSRVDHDTTSSEERSRCTSCLPQLNFQEEVCRDLHRSFQSSGRYDWTLIQEVAGKYGLHHVIGGRMGLEHVDVLCELFRKDMKHLLTRMLRLLGDDDLLSCKKVSRTWMKIIIQDRAASKRCADAERRLMEIRRPGVPLSRDFALTRAAFSCMQPVASTPTHKAAKKPPCQSGGVRNTGSTRFQQFQEAAKTLKVGESLRKCVRCSSPARFEEAMLRCVCTRTSCGFQFCTRCQSTFHGADPCRALVRTSLSQDKLLAGTAQSKRNVKRL